MAAKSDIFNLDQYLDSVEELLKNTMQNPLCTPHEVSLIGAHTERLLGQAKRHSRLGSKMPFSTHPTCLPSSVASPEPYPAFRAVRMLQLSRDSAPEASDPGVLASTAAADIAYSSFNDGSDLCGLNASLTSGSQSSVISVKQMRDNNYISSGQKELNLSHKRARIENQSPFQGRHYASVVPVAPVAPMYPSYMGYRATSIEAVESKQELKSPLGIPMAPPSLRGQAKKANQDRIKFVNLISYWKTGEGLKKGPTELFDPLGVFSALKEAARLKNIEESKVDWTAFQITAMVASLGSADAILGCRKVIVRLRDIENFNSLPGQLTHPRSFKTFYLPLSSPMANLEKLAPRFFSDPLASPKDYDFEYRHYVTQFCKYVVLRRDALMKEYRGLSAEKAMAEVYASVVSKVKPRTSRFRNDGTVSAGFKAYQATLEGNTVRGFRWLELMNRFGVGILALYDTQGRYSRSTDITIDTRDLKDEEFELLLEHLDTEGSADFQWLKRICGLINQYIEQGLRERLTMPRLSIESGPARQFLVCDERTEELAMFLMPAQHDEASQ